MKANLIKKRRKYKRLSNRGLSMNELIALDFLWTWKVATTNMLHEVAYSKKSKWWSYKVIRRLRKENYIQALPKGKYLGQELWALTNLGFEVVLMDRDDIDQLRYKPHAPTHDFLATTLQLGSFWKEKRIKKQFFTEQMLSSLAPANFPSRLRKNFEHIPDGITYVYGKLNEAVIGYEVDINLKPVERYESTWSYYKHGAKPDVIFWLVKNIWMAKKIFNVIQSNCRSSEDTHLSQRIAFVLLEDFKNELWEAPIVLGKLKGISVSKVHAKLLQKIGYTNAKLSQKRMQEIYFPKYKSPQMSDAYADESNITQSKHPMGADIILNNKGGIDE